MTQDEALALWEYRDGNLYWRQNLGRMRIGDEVGHAWHTTTSTGRVKSYGIVTYKGKTYLLHRIIFLMHYGFFPDQIDHIDGNSLNNNIDNLRLCEVHENCCNRGMPSNNTSGYKGVYWSKQSQKWVAQITKRRKQYYLGLYPSAADARLSKIILNHRLSRLGAFADFSAVALFV